MESWRLLFAEAFGPGDANQNEASLVFEWFSGYRAIGRALHLISDPAYQIVSR